MADCFKERIPTEEFDDIKQEVRSDFPNDEMMFELHTTRILNAIKKGYWRVRSS